MGTSAHAYKGKKRQQRHREKNRKIETKNVLDSFWSWKTLEIFTKLISKN